MARKGVQTPVILRDNARPHKSRLVQEFLIEKRLDTWSHPAYLRDNQPCDYNGFGPLKDGLSGLQFKNWDQFENRLKVVISEGLQKGHFRGVARLPERWQKVIDKEGNYI